jgi:diguanylate cyclase (GGDEF)-like protein
MTLRRRLITVILLAAIVPTLLVGAVNMVSYMLSINETIDAHALQTTGEAAHAIDSLIQNATSDLHSLGATPLPSEARPEDIARLISVWSYTYPYFRDLLWVSPQGEVVAATDPKLAGQPLAATHAELAGELPYILSEPTDHIHISDFDQAAPGSQRDAGGDASATHALKLMTRVDNEHGEPAGVVVAVVATEAIAVTLRDLRHRLSGARSVALLSASGKVLLSSEPEADLLKSHPLAAHILDRISASTTGSAQIEMSTGGGAVDIAVARTAGIGPLREASWLVVAMRDEKADREELWRGLPAAATLLSTAIFAAWLLAIWLSRAISRPIERLAAIARSFGGGDLMVRAETSGMAEIGALGAAFNHMVDDLLLERTRLDDLNDELQTHLEQLHAHAALLEANQRDSAGRAELSSLLQAADSIDDAAAILPPLLGKVLPEHCGAVYLIKSSLNYLDCLGSFGAACGCPQTVAPEECWALRRGRTYAATDPAHDIYCAHVSPVSAPTGYICVPLQARGAPVGLLHVRYTGADAAVTDALAERIQRLAEHIAMGLANLKLRDALKEQSIRDALTGLYNRRYLEESLDRELARAQREGRALAVFMLDVDHFKRFNDNHGHEAGDAALRLFGQVLLCCQRTGDVIARLGGEEFCVLLAKADTAAALAFDQRLRTELERTAPDLLPFTLDFSSGHALYTDREQTLEYLMARADEALYQAKAGGRGQLVSDAQAS